MDESSEKEEENSKKEKDRRTQKDGYQVAFRHPVLVIRFILSCFHNEKIIYVFTYLFNIEHK